MNTAIVSMIRRWRKRWAATTLMVILSSLSVALLVALAAITDGVLIREVFPGADEMVILTRPDRKNAWQRVFTTEELPLASAESGVPVTAFDNARRIGPEADDPSTAMVAADFFEFIGQRPQVGRLLQRADASETRIAVISDAMWRRAFGGDAKVVGRGLPMNGTTYTIIGVTAPHFSFPRGTDIWTVIDPQLAVAQLFSFLGRRPPGMSAADLDARSRIWRPTALRDDLYPADGRQIVVLAGVSALLLLTVWIYLALTQLADAAGRLNEFRVRIAIGAGRGDILRAGLVDAYVLVAACVALGALLAPAVLTMLVSRLPSTLLTGKPLVIDARSAWLLIVALGIGWLAVTVATLPVLRQAFRSGVSAGDYGRAVSTSGRPLRWIVAAQFLSTTAVLYLLGLATASIHGVIAADLGYEPQNVLAIRAPRPAAFRPATAETESDRQAWITRLQTTLDELGRIPGAIAVGTSLEGLGSQMVGGGQRVWLPEAGIDHAIRSDSNSVSGHYFDALQIPLVAGRWFDTQVDRNRPRRGWDEMVIDTTLAAALGLDRAAIGREISIGGFPTKIIGIAGAIRSREADRAPRPRYYLKVSAGNRSMTVFLVRFAGNVTTLRAAAARVVQERYGTMTPPSMVLLTDELERLRAPYQGRFEILSFAGWMTGGLTIVGVFGVCAYTVARRRRELAVRIAMGATRAQILWTSVRGLLIASAAGTCSGLIVGVGLGTQLSAALYGVTPTDPWVLASIVAVGLVIAAVGAILPVRRAWVTDVANVLRQD